MIVKHLDQIVGTDADVDTEGWTSRRLILKDGGMGYSVHDTIIKAGAELDMHYKNHLETVYLTEGAGETGGPGHRRDPPAARGLDLRPEPTTTTTCSKPTRARTCAWSAFSTRPSPARKCTTKPAPTRCATEGGQRRHVRHHTQLQPSTRLQRPTATPRASRAEPHITNRLDPVVYGQAETGPLADSQLRFFEDNGYLSLDQLFSEAELASYMLELQRLRADEHAKSAPEAVIEPESRELRSIFAVHRSSEILRELCGHPRLVAMARQLLGSDVYIHQSRINYKSGFRGKEFFWHSDFETWHVEDGVPSHAHGELLHQPDPQHRAQRPADADARLAPPLRRLRRRDAREPLQGLAQAPGSRRARRRQPHAARARIRHHLAQGPWPVRSPSSTATPCTARIRTSRRCRAATSSWSTTASTTRRWHPFCGLAPRPNFIAEREDFTPLACPGQT